jgi:hypothetical protein
MLALVQTIFETLKFPQWIVTAPHFNAVCFDDKMIIDLKKTIKTANHEGILVVFEYDTTFQMSEFYVSILSYMHPLLRFQSNANKSPPIPVGFLFHEKKYQEYHEIFWQQMKKVNN